MQSRQSCAETSSTCRPAECAFSSWVSVPCANTRMVPLNPITVESLLQKTGYQGFPVVRSRTDVTLLGDISRADLRIAISGAHSPSTNTEDRADIQPPYSCFPDKAELEHLVSPDAPCLFCPDDGEVSPPSHSNEFDEAEATSIDFTSYVNQVSCLSSRNLPRPDPSSFARPLSPSRQSSLWRS